MPLESIRQEGLVSQTDYCASWDAHVQWVLFPEFLDLWDFCLSLINKCVYTYVCLCVYRLTLLLAMILITKQIGSPLSTVLCGKSLRLNNDDKGLLLKLILYTAFLWWFDGRTTCDDLGGQFKAALNRNWRWAAHLGFGSRTILSYYGSEIIQMDPLLLPQGNTLQ